MSIRSIATIGAMWPRCASCGHIAQEHDSDGCSAQTKGQCPTCKGWEHPVPCACEAYLGPTWEEFKQKLTPEELVHYRWQE